MTVFENSRCPHCGTYLHIKWSSYSRYVIYKYREIKKIKVQRHKCKVCNKTFGELPEDVFPRLRYSKSAIIQMVEWKYLHTAGLRRAGKLADREITYPASTIWKYLQRLGPKSKEALKNLKIPFSGVISIDEDYYKCGGGIGVHIVVSAVFKDKNGKYTVIIGSEDFTVKLSEEAKKDKRKAKKEVRELLPGHIEKVLQEVAERFGVTEVRMVLTDDEPIYSRIIPEIFPFAVHRICLWHIMKNLVKALNKELGTLPLVQGVINRLNHLWSAKTQQEALKIVDAIANILNGMSEKIERRLTGLKERIFENKIGLFDFRTNNPSEWTFARIEPGIKIIKSFQSDGGMSNYLWNTVMYYNCSCFVDGKHKGKSPIELVCPTGAGTENMTPFYYV